MLFKQLISLSLLLLFVSTSQAQLHKRMKRFIGTWQYEGIIGFEVWNANDNFIEGKSYRVKNGKDTVLIENMRIILENNKLVLYVQVLNQNGGKEIRFDESKKKKYKFVNETHDFPKSIYYQFKWLKRKKVEVLLNHPHKETHTKPLMLVRLKV